MKSLQESLLDIDSVEASTSAAILFNVLTRKNENGRDVKITADQIRKIVIGGADLTKDNTFKRNFGGRFRICDELHQRQHQCHYSQW